MWFQLSEGAEAKAIPQKSVPYLCGNLINILFFNLSYWDSVLN